MNWSFIFFSQICIQKWWSIRTKKEWNILYWFWETFVHIFLTRYSFWIRKLKEISSWEKYFDHSIIMIDDCITLWSICFIFPLFPIWWIYTWSGNEWKFLCMKWIGWYDFSLFYRCSRNTDIFVKMTKNDDYDTFSLNVFSFWSFRK